MNTKAIRMAAVTAGVVLSWLMLDSQAALVGFTAAEQGGANGIMAQPWKPLFGNLGVTVTANSSDQNAAAPYLSNTGLGVYVDGLGDPDDVGHQMRIRGDVGILQELVFAFDTPVPFADLTVGLYFLNLDGIVGTGDDPVFFYWVDGGTDWTWISEAALLAAWTQVGDTLNPYPKNADKFEGYISFSGISGSGNITKLRTGSMKGAYQVSYLKTTSVPDGGMTVMMLGMALLGLGGIARKIRG